MTAALMNRELTPDEVKSVKVVGWATIVAFVLSLLMFTFSIGFLDVLVIAISLAIIGAIGYVLYFLGCCAIFAITGKWFGGTLKGSHEHNPWDC